MKKFKIIFATVMLGIATVGGFQAYEYANMSSAAPFLLENAEALAAGGESDWDHANGQPSEETTCGNGGCTSTIIPCKGGGSGCNVKSCSSHPD